MKNNPLNSTLQNPPAIIHHHLLTKGDKTLLYALWSLYLTSYKAYGEIERLRGIYERFSEMHPNRQELIDKTTEWFNIVMGVHYPVGTQEYNESVEVHLGIER
jgi:hypothetical protein